MCSKGVLGALGYWGVLEALEHWSYGGSWSSTGGCWATAPQYHATLYVLSPVRSPGPALLVLLTAATVSTRLSPVRLWEHPPLTPILAVIF